MASKKNTCAWCFGFGLHESYFRIGLRRVMEKGVNNKPMHPNEKVVPCDRCHKPEASGDAKK